MDVPSAGFAEDEEFDVCGIKDSGAGAGGGGGGGGGAPPVVGVEIATGAGVGTESTYPMKESAGEPEEFHLIP